MKRTVLSVCLALLSMQVCLGLELTFTGEVSTEWFNRTNWSLRIIPQSSDDVVIKAPVFVPQEAAFRNMTIDGGEASGTFTVGGILNLADGVLYADVTIAPGAEMIIAGDGRKHLNGDITNHGTVRWSGNNQIRASNSVFLNKSDGLFLIENDREYLKWAGLTQPSIINEGTIRKSAGTELTTFLEITFENKGLVEVLTGRLYLVSGVETSGEFRVAEGASVDLAGGTVTLLPGATFTGAGFYGVSALAEVNGEITSANFQVTGDMVGSVQLSGKLNWNAGFLRAAVMIKPGGLLDINGHSVKNLGEGGKLENQGTIRWRDDSELRVSNAEIINRAGGLFEILNNQQVGLFAGTKALILNEGLMRKSGEAGTTMMATTEFVNSGVLEMQTGTLILPASFVTSGEVVVAEGASVNLNSGTTVLLPGATFTGAGFYGVVGATFVDGEITSANFQVKGELKGTNQISGRVNWNNGYLNSTTTVKAGGVLDINAPSVKHLSNGRLENQGTIRWRDDSELRLNDAELVNRAGAIIEVLNDQQLGLFAGTKAVLLNEGLIRKSGGTGTTRLSTTEFVNSGILEILTGQVLMPDNFTLSGEVKVAEGASANLNSGTTVLKPGATFSGNGFYGVMGSTFVDGEITSANFQVTGELKGTNLVSGKLNWSGGYLSSMTTIKAGGLLDINSATVKNITNARVENQGTIRWAGNSDVRLSDAELVNRAGAVIEILNDEQLALFAGTKAVLLNEGMIRKSGGTEITRFGTTEFVNSGTIEVQTGGIYLPDNFIHSGEVKVAEGARAELITGTTVLQPGAKFSGAGFYGVTGGVVVQGEITAENFQVNGVLTGVNTVSGKLNWTGGTVSSQTTIKTGGLLDINGLDVKRLSSAKLENLGTIRWRDLGEVRIDDAEIFNRAGARFEVLNDSVIGLFAGSKATFVNEGTVRKSGADGTTTFGFTEFQNLGVLEIVTGTLLFTEPYAQNSGQVIVHGTLVAPEVQINGGILSGAGTIQGKLVNKGRIETGFPHGKLQVQGDYEQTGVLVVKIGSEAPESFGLSITGKATLGGELVVETANGFVPTFGEEFIALEFNSSTGNFAVITKPALFNTFINAHNVGFALPSAFSFVKGEDGNFSIQITVEGNTRYRVEASTDLVEWTTLVETTAAEGLLRFTDPQSGQLGMRFYRINEITGQ